MGRASNYLWFKGRSEDTKLTEAVPPQYDTTTAPSTGSSGSQTLPERVGSLTSRRLCSFVDREDDTVSLVPTFVDAVSQSRSSLPRMTTVQTSIGRGTTTTVTSPPNAARSSIALAITLPSISADPQDRSIMITGSTINRQGADATLNNKRSVVISTPDAATTATVNPSSANHRHPNRASSLSDLSRSSQIGLPNRSKMKLRGSHTFHGPLLASSFPLRGRVVLKSKSRDGGGGSNENGNKQERNSDINDELAKARLLPPSKPKIGGEMLRKSNELCLWTNSSLQEKTVWATAWQAVLVAAEHIQVAINAALFAAAEDRLNWVELEALIQPLKFVGHTLDVLWDTHSKIINRTNEYARLDFPSNLGGIHFFIQKKIGTCIDKLSCMPVKYGETTTEFSRELEAEVSVLLNIYAAGFQAMKQACTTTLVHAQPFYQKHFTSKNGIQATFDEQVVRSTLAGNRTALMVVVGGTPWSQRQERLATLQLLTADGRFSQAMHSMTGRHKVNSLILAYEKTFRRPLDKLMAKCRVAA